MAQTRRAPGNLMADARTIDRVRHVLSVWSDRAAMRAFPANATGSVLGFTAERALDWTDGYAILLRHPRPA